MRQHFCHWKCVTTRIANGLFHASCSCGCIAIICLSAQIKTNNIMTKDLKTRPHKAQRQSCNPMFSVQTLVYPPYFLLHSCYLSLQVWRSSSAPISTKIPWRCTSLNSVVQEGAVTIQLLSSSVTISSLSAQHLHVWRVPRREATVPTTRVKTLY